MPIKHSYLGPNVHHEMQKSSPKKASWVPGGGVMVPGTFPGHYFQTSPGWHWPEMVPLPLLSELALSLHCPQQKNHYPFWHSLEPLLPSSLWSPRLPRYHKTHALLRRAPASLVQLEGIYGWERGSTRWDNASLRKNKFIPWHRQERANSKLHEQKLKAPLRSPYYSTSNRIQSDNLSKHWDRVPQLA